MSITTKQARCARWVWGAITRYPHLLTSELVGMQTDYSLDDIKRALSDLEAGGQIKREVIGPARGYIALVPFVVEAPAWAV